MCEETNTYKILFVNIHRMRPGMWNMLTHSSIGSFSTRCVNVTIFLWSKLMKKIMQKAKINFMSKSTRTSNRCPSLPKLWFARPFFSSLSGVLHVCKCNAKAQQTCARILKSSLWELLPSMPALRRELIIYHLHVLLCRTSVLNATSWVYSCPDIFVFLHATLIL
jgi:hypothetical protein